MTRHDRRRSTWVARLIFNLTALAFAVLFAWQAIRYFRAGEDYWAAFFFAMAVSWAVRSGGEAHDA